MSDRATGKLKISFVMPRTGEWPSGGLRVIYQYANHLAMRGHDVTVVHPGRFVVDPDASDHIKNIITYVLRKASGRFKPNAWIKMHPSVKLTCVPSLSQRHIPDGEVVIATAWQTAEWVSRYSPSKGKKFYLIQHLETWNGPPDRVLATWKAPLQKVVISKWLVDVAHGLGQDAIQVRNGLDVNTFQRMVPTEARRPDVLMMLYHKAEWKGAEDGLAALKLVQREEPETRAILFGVPTRPEGLPDWIEYHQRPSPQGLAELYNRAAIFVAPSTTEGWGLTGCEALLSGAALVATDIDGHREFAFHEDTALLCPSRSPSALAECILRLVKDHELRIGIAKRGHDFVSQLTWERATAELEATLGG